MKKILLILLLAVAGNTQAADFPQIPAFIDLMVQKHQFEREELQFMFEEAKHLPKIVEIMDRPSTRKPWPDYSQNFVNDQRIRAGVVFWQQHVDVVARASRQYQIPPEMIVSIIGIETIYGRTKGGYRVLDALTTLAFDYPRRADFFRDELEQLLLLTREQQLDIFALKGSYAGAMGWPQFMPSSYRKYAVDFNANGKLDLLNEPEDAIGSVAHYLARFGWKMGQPVVALPTVEPSLAALHVNKSLSLYDWHQLGVTVDPDILPLNLTARLLDYTLDEDSKEYWLVFGNFDVILKYNKSSYYAMTVYLLAEEIKAAKRAAELEFN